MQRDAVRTEPHSRAEDKLQFSVQCTVRAVEGLHISGFTALSANTVDTLFLPAPGLNLLVAKPTLFTLQNVSLRCSYSPACGGWARVAAGVTPGQV